MSQNRLKSASSPYLLQHEDNPVHWWEWSEEALKEAQKQDKPILLSVGYAACHWCHVMAHESFEDPETADLMNKLFINIKVDREERPDIDGLYMAALHRLGERGGWPMTMFLTPEAEPFWGGTYFPLEEKYGMPSFKQVLNELSRIYIEDHTKVKHNAKAILEDLKQAPQSATGPEFSENILKEFAAKLATTLDTHHGGVKTVPKFPQIPLMQFMWHAGLRYNNTELLDGVKLTMTKICLGGIYDHIGGGFTRYSTDERWLVPHFEKMLYDNGLILNLLVELWKETSDPLYATRIAESIEWLEREMLQPDGGFASSLDADTDGEEGKFYVWSRAEIEELLEEDEADLFCMAYDISEKGNWEGANIPNKLMDLVKFNDDEIETISKAKEKLFVSRETTRTNPGCDDKILADWNGLVIGALAKAGYAFNNKEWLKLAEDNFAYISKTLLSTKNPHHAVRNGKLSAPAMATDFANMITAGLELYNVTKDSAYLDKSVEWTTYLNEHYLNNDANCYTLAAQKADDLIHHLQTAMDEATPNANGVMIQNLARLYSLTGEQKYEDQARQILRRFTPDAINEIMSHQSTLSGALTLITPISIVVALPKDTIETTKIDKALHEISLPNVVITKTDNPSGYLKDKQVINNLPTIYICVGQSCSQPITNLDELADQLKENRSKS